jgi:hypothetical protein
LDCGDTYNCSIGDILAGVLGSENGTSLGGGLYKHKFVLADQVENPAFNMITDKDPVAKQYIGFRPSSLKIALVAKDGEVKVAVEGILKTTQDGYGTSFSNCAATTTVYEQPLTAHDTTTLILGGSSAGLTEATKMDIEIKNEIEPQHFIGDDRTIGALRSKAFETNVTYESVVFSDETEKTKFFANTTGAFRIQLDSAVTTGAYINFVFGNLMYTKFDGPSLKDTDILTVSGAATVQGASSTSYVELVNTYPNNYCTGVAI